MGTPILLARKVGKKQHRLAQWPICDSTAEPVSQHVHHLGSAACWHNRLINSLFCTAGALPVLLDGKLLLLHACPGSNKLNTARSLDLLGFAASFHFTDKMKTESVALLEQLEAWVDKQALSLDLAQDIERISGNFDSLLKVMDSLYQVS
jgi:hypothetical protein